MSASDVNVVTGLLLAAGASRRFGGPKLLARVKGEALILHSARALLACDRIVAVVRVQDRQIHDLLRQEGIEMVFNHQAEQGMGRSIAVAVDATRQSSGWCILPADMPAVLPATTREIVRALKRGAPVVAPVFQGQRGHPVGFAAIFREALLMLSGDTGAQSILATHRDQVQRLAVEDAGILLDIDRPVDLGK
ncbi:MAG: nucleotidyltransferase family protein [Gammaproteobacteria bacterium]|nr:nucleotidyltransferase family protein [Gammaproteobacteria bacterium]